MGNNDLSGNENILIKIDHNNLIYIDPNSVISNGEVEPRGIKQENLIMYANLEADLVPRTTLISDDTGGTLFSVAKGTINFLKNQQGGDFDTSWTNAFNGRDDVIIENNKPTDQYKINDIGYDGTAQSFGIDSINITTKGFNAIPQVTINFIDVRGKTLFESPENSPYKAFFHLPWPIFYLTVKGYYGKAIRYRLHLVKFNTKFNETNGNFEITTNFVGSTFAYLNDIPINGILNAPYMYGIEKVTKDKELKDGVEQITISKSSKGYSILNSVYNEYKQKGLIDKNFPVKTLRELIVVAETLDKILEKEIFDELVDPKIFAGVKDFENNVVEFEASVSEWGKRNLSTQFFPRTEGKNVDTNEGIIVEYYYLSGQDKKDRTKVSGISKSGTLEKTIYGNDGTGGYLKNLEKIQNTINDPKTKNKTNTNFTIIKSNNYVKLLDDYVKTENEEIGVAIKKLIDDIRKIINEFRKQRDTLQKEVEIKMNTAIKHEEKGIGFNPTIRNIFAVVLANAEVYIRLMKDVHTRAFDIGAERKEDLKDYSDETPGGGAVYPWPEVKMSAVGGSKHKVIVYPGDNALAVKLNTRDPKVWPEVEFVEEYMAIATKQYDTLSDKEGGIGKINYIFESNKPENDLKKISSLDSIRYGNPYINKSIPAILYEIFERSYYITLFDSFDDNTINELANIEFKNIEESLTDDVDVKQILKTEINTTRDLYMKMAGLSPYERYPDLKDQLPTTPYLADSISTPFKIEQYIGGNGVDNNGSYGSLSKNLKNYAPKSYRKNIYPFNSDLYLSYINKTAYTDDEFKFGDNLRVDTRNGFISSPVYPRAWVKEEFIPNLFLNNFKISGTSINILNTPYFHKQLYSDFNNSSQYSKYAGSAYLLLNSLPFNDLEDKIDFPINNTTTIRMSSLFREIGSTHFIPYHLMLKWGSIYHRYKKQIIDGIDIIDGFVNGSNITTSFDGKLFFDQYNVGPTFTDFTTKTGTINYSSHTNVGIHPFYDAVFHNIINGYTHYDVSLGDTSFSVMTSSDSIITHGENTNGITYWTSVVDNSKYGTTPDLTYTVLPSDGYTNIPTTDGFFNKEQKTMNVIWSENENLGGVTFSGLTFPTYQNYNRTFNSSNDNKYGIGTNYRKVIDLIATFSPDILSEFENMFLTFASAKVEEEIPYIKYDRVLYHNFQDLLKEICTVEKKNGDPTNVQSLFQTIQIRQEEKLEEITRKLLDNNNLLSFTITNPKEIDAHVIGGFAEIYNGNTFAYGDYNISQIAGNSKYIDLYIGEDVDGNYLQFFATNDVELSEESVLTFRPIVQIFASVYDQNPSITKEGFKQYLRDNVLTLFSSPSLGDTKLTKEHSSFLIILIKLFKDLTIDPIKSITPTIGYNDDPLKIEMYSFFKTFNDRWIGGNSIGQRLLLEEFLFLDKANKDIGSEAYFNLTKLIPIGDSKNQKSNLYGVISMLIQGTGFDMRALPAYVNFYGANHTNKVKPMPSKTVAKSLFGTFLEVDYQESSPKIIIQYTGPTSKHLDLLKYNKDYKFVDDSFNVENINNNPLVITAPEVFNTENLFKSNKVVAFEVSFGDQNQSIFKGIELDQSSIRNTTESFIAQENLARSESGSNAYQVDIGLFNIYRQASYSCKVTCLGNVMIQPTMYFYLKNVPMFRGAYWITDVTHNINGNLISTSFTGTRIPKASLPDPKDSFMASYKPLFDSIVNRAILRVKQTTQVPTTEVTLDLKEKGNATINIPSNTKETDVVNRCGLTDFGVPYNGGGLNKEKYIQMIKYKGEEWLQAVVIQYAPPTYSPSTPLSIFLKTTQSTLVYFNDIYLDAAGNDRGLKFYATRFELNTGIPDKLITCITEFTKPNSNKTITLPASNDFISSPKRAEGPVHVGPNMKEYGIAMSPALMKELGVHTNDVVYFRMKSP